MAVKAVVIRDGRLLTIKSKDRVGDGQFYHSLPGGGQRPGETLHEALRRECLEEVGVSVEVGPLLYVREYIGLNHEYADLDRDFHQVEMIFACSLPQDVEPVLTKAADERQVAVAWIPLDELEAYRFRPRALQSLLRLPGPHRLSYLGDVN